MDIQKRRAMMKSFITSRFSYCPLVCMFHSRKLNDKINAIHERTLRIAYCDKHSTFQQLLEKDNSVSIHHRNLQVLATEMFKVNMNLSPDLMNDIFLKKNKFIYSTKKWHIFYSISELCISRNRILVVFGTKNLGISAAWN